MVASAWSDDFHAGGPVFWRKCSRRGGASCRARYDQGRGTLFCGIRLSSKGSLRKTILAGLVLRLSNAHSPDGIHVRASRVLARRVGSRRGARHAFRFTLLAGFLARRDLRGVLVPRIFAGDARVGYRVLARRNCTVHSLWSFPLPKS